MAADPDKIQVQNPPNKYNSSNDNNNNNTRVMAPTINLNQTASPSSLPETTLADTHSAGPSVTTDRHSNIRPPRRQSSSSSSFSMSHSLPPSFSSPSAFQVHQSLSRTYTEEEKDSMSADIPYEELKRLFSHNPLEDSNSPASFPHVRNLNPFQKKRILVTGGAGFVGSHLVDRLMLLGHDVICVDNYFTGNKTNVAHWIGHPNFELIRHDVVDPIMLEVDQIYHLACPASPVHYQANPVKTLKTGFLGTYNMLGLAKRVKARILIASTSEIYGDPLEHPQKETYWGNVNIQGPRACYDESKRVGETLAYSYAAQERVDVRVARIFNTYGPRMNWNDGRVVSNFILQALKNEDLTIYGDGESTRSFQFVMDLVDGLVLLMNNENIDASDPVNIGNPEEYTIQQFAQKIIFLVEQATGRPCSSKLSHLNPLIDDPHCRKPDTTRAYDLLGWSPQWTVDDGIKETVEYFNRQIGWLSKES